ncbi:MAG: 16S rRNA (uracil(1498)-N(3))-methyltransferase [Cyanobacteriota bacterium]|nr:16S rRNA (uracil(1498)-N(3))-methyltransferase [Cyanobacteriota bacterium]
MTAAVAERRRLLIDASRLPPTGEHRCVHLNDQEARYLRKVLRLKPGSQVDVVDGGGHLWTARLIPGDQLELTTDRAQPLETGSKPMPQLGLAMALVRRGMDDVMRMACELGVDHVQPIQADRSVPQAEDRPERWGVILQEAVEQSERLWRPDLQPCIQSEQWWMALAAEDLRLIAVTRDAGCPHLETWLHQTAGPAPRIWLAIGPEGGWSEREVAWALASGWIGVTLGDTILRSSTAAVAGISALCSWRTLSA